LCDRHRYVSELRSRTASIEQILRTVD